MYAGTVFERSLILIHTYLLIPIPILLVLEQAMNAALERLAAWMDELGLGLAVHKTQVVACTRKRAKSLPVIVLRGERIALRGNIEYLGLEIDKRLSFESQVEATGPKALRVPTQLTRLMSNVGGPRESRRKLLTSVAHSVLLYASPAWGHKLEAPGGRNIMIRAQRMACMRQICAYKTISAAASPPVDLVAKMR